MRIGVPKEIKNFEDRVAIIPAGVRELVLQGHEVLIETSAGLGAGLDDAAYEAAGAKIAPDAEAVFAASEMIVKVKEPQAVERARLRADQILFTYLHLAPDPDQTTDLLNSGATCIAYETVTSASGGLPLLMPMSEVAGRMAVQAGAHCLENAMGGCGMLLGGVPGVPPADVLILGGGVAGSHAAQMAIGMGANVTVVDRSGDVLRRLNMQFGTAVKTAYSNKHTLEELVAHAELVIGTVLIPGASAPKLITRDMLATMRRGAAIVDVAIDQGGCTETSKATTHSDPTYVVDGIVHYCVANMPGGVARTSTFALANATLPFVSALANKSWRKALADDPHLKAGLNAHGGKITYKAVSEALGLDYVPADTVIAA
ncbi:alanine dehydrogenase [Breoghania sp. L-A4]|uniref:alanine dehydrogenase n=1 Tax=Breoghania sp. L-A4 TaxID=2304600 RepID=UPI000E359F4A|nr:alanine dehydrogenase [Breoghania sp. L-A4]AXS39582.1 alanine dehydrogenase [Breoghania sp. L-A4]